MYLCMYVPENASMYACMYICKYVCMYECISTWIYVCIYAVGSFCASGGTYFYMHVRVCICMLHARMHVRMFIWCCWLILTGGAHPFKHSYMPTIVQFTCIYAYLYAYMRVSIHSRVDMRIASCCPRCAWFLERIVDGPITLLMDSVLD